MVLNVPSYRNQQKLQASTEQQQRDQAVQSLEAMGYSKEWCTQAVQARGTSLGEAVAWLLQHGELPQVGVIVAIF